VNREYFVYAVRYKLKEMESKTHGATMKHIVKKDFDNTLIPFPTLEEQENIANLLDNAIEACKLCEDKKHIWFKCVQESGKIILSVKNTVKGETMMRLPLCRLPHSEQ